MRLNLMMTLCLEESVNDTKKRLEIAREKRGNLLKEKIKQKSVKREER